jgi:hypothetical protein
VEYHGFHVSPGIVDKICEGEFFVTSVEYAFTGRVKFLRYNNSSDAAKAGLLRKDAG